MSNISDFKLRVMLEQNKIQILGLEAKEKILKEMSSYISNDMKITFAESMDIMINKLAEAYQLRIEAGEARK